MFGHRSLAKHNDNYCDIYNYQEIIKNVKKSTIMFNMI